MRIASTYIFALLFASTLCAQGYNGVYWHKDVKDFLYNQKNKHVDTYSENGTGFFKKYIEMISSGESYAELKSKYPNFITKFSGSDLYGIYELRYNSKVLTERVYYYVHNDDELYYLYAEKKNGQSGGNGLSKKTLNIIKARRDEIIKAKIEGLNIVDVNHSWSKYSRYFLKLTSKYKIQRSGDVSICYSRKDVYAGRNNIASMIKDSDYFIYNGYMLYRVPSFINNKSSEECFKGFVEELGGEGRAKFFKFINQVATNIGINTSHNVIVQENGVYYNFIHADAVEPDYFIVRNFFEGNRTAKEVFMELSDAQIGALISSLKNGQIKSAYDEFLKGTQVGWDDIRSKIFALSNIYNSYLDIQSKFLIGSVSEKDFEQVCKYVEKKISNKEFSAARYVYSSFSSLPGFSPEELRVLSKLNEKLNEQLSKHSSVEYYSTKAMSDDFEKEMTKRMSLYLYGKEDVDKGLNELLVSALVKIRDGINNSFAMHNVPVEELLTKQDCDLLVGKYGVLYYLEYKSDSNLNYLFTGYILKELVDSNIGTANRVENFNANLYLSLKLKLDDRMESLKMTDDRSKELLEEKDKKELFKKYFRPNFDYIRPDIKSDRIKGY